MSFPPRSSFRSRLRERRPALPAAEDGFTLIELLICIVIGALMVSALFRSISAQGRLTDLQSAREEVQQNSRASLELIASELRAISTPGGIVRATRDSITFRTTRLWGVVCSSSAEALDLLVADIDARHFSVTSGSGLVVNLGTTSEPVWTGAATIQSATPHTGPCGEAEPDAAAAHLALQISAFPGGGSGLPQAGDLGGIHDQVTYRSGTSSGLRGRWIQRRSGDGAGSTNQPLAGPIRAAGVGLRFRYFTSGGVAIAPPVTSTAALDSIRAIEVLVDATSLDQSGKIRAARRDSVTIPLRNLR